MVFTTSNLFKDIACPEGEKCTLTNCIFSHDLRPRQISQATKPAESLPESQTAQSDKQDDSTKPPTKRRKVTYENLASKPLSRAEQIRSELAAQRKAKAEPASAPAPEQVDSQHSLNGHVNAAPPPPSLTRPVSPPTNGKVATSSGFNNRTSDNSSHTSSVANNNNDHDVSHQPPLPAEVKPLPEEKLNPRLISNDPAGHAKRSLYLKHIHAEMVRLNQAVRTSKDSEGKLVHSSTLVLSDQDLVRLALDDEERMVKGNPVVYINVVKNRIAALKKMKAEEWIKEVRAQFAKDVAAKAAVNGKVNGTKEVKPLETALRPDEELLIVPHLIADQNILTPYGYIPTPPTEHEAADAQAAVEASAYFEVCDRCSARFQVFPDRNDDGQLTSNGPCRHHPNRKVFPQKTKGDFAMGALKEPYYPCCNQVVGSPGCTDNEFHVFKASSAARLAAVMPFITTPENATPAKDSKGKDVEAVSFDCEMGYTVYGLELIRLTAVSWPTGEQLVDVLVRPLGTIIDLNSRFSGVWPEHFANAVPYDEWNNIPPPPTSPPLPMNDIHTSRKSPSSALPIVESPQRARELLCSSLTPDTPLIGHAIDNDLNAVRLCHPSIVDTVLLFPHPRGLPMRFGLKMLSSKYLNRSIQTGGDAGHDSLEDARATGDLVRYKIGEKWRTLKGGGWSIADGQLTAPSTLRSPDQGSGNTSDVAKKVLDQVFDKRSGRKRRKNRSKTDGADDSTEDEEVSVGVGVAAYLQRSGEGTADKKEE